MSICHIIGNAQFQVQFLVLAPKKLIIMRARFVHVLKTRQDTYLQNH